MLLACSGQGSSLVRAPSTKATATGGQLARWAQALCCCCCKLIACGGQMAGQNTVLIGIGWPSGKFAPSQPCLHHLFDNRPSKTENAPLARSHKPKKSICSFRCDDETVEFHQAQ